MTYVAKPTRAWSFQEAPIGIEILTDKGTNQCDQIGRFIKLWATFKAFGNN